MSRWSVKLSWAMMFVAVVAAGEPAVADDDHWPQWRGPTGDNHAAAGVRVPDRWNLQSGENIVWQTELPGRGHSTPAVTDRWIFLTTADDDAQTQSLIKLDRGSGKIVQTTVLHRGTLPARIHSNNSHASPSPIVHDDHVFASFHTDDAIVLSKVSVDGRVIWQRRIAAFRPSRYEFGYGASPMLYDDHVIVAAEYDGPESGIYAVSIDRGDLVYKIPRRSNLSFSSPGFGTVGGRDQMVIAGDDRVDAFDPATAARLWSADAGTSAHCGTAVFADRSVIVSGGYPGSRTWCVAADGTGRVVWENNNVAYEQSLLIFGNHVVTVANSGAAFCHRVADGTEMWRGRALGSGVSASPLLVDDRIIAADERGKVVVIRATPDRYDEVATNQTGESIFASPIAVGDRLYIRTAVRTGGRRVERLVAIGS